MLPTKRVNLGKDHSHSTIHRRLPIDELMMVIFVLRTTRSSEALALVIVISLLYFILHELMRHGR